MRHLPCAVAALAAVLTLAACTDGASRSTPATGASVGDPAPTSAAPSAAAPVPPRLRVRTVARLPTGFGREAVISTGRGAIVAGGFVGGHSSLATAYRLDLPSGRVRPMPPLRVPVHDTAGALAGGPLVIGGGNAAEQSVVQAWDGTGWKVVGRLPQPRSDLVAVTVSGRVLVLGGYDGARPAEPGILRSTDGRTWTTIGTLPVPVRYPAAAVAQGAVWLVGGESSGAMQTAIQRVDPVTGRARVVGRMPHPLGHAVALPFGDRLLIAGGRTATDTLTGHLWWFDLRTKAVSSAGHLPGPLSDAAVAQRGSAFYLIGGETPGVSDRIIEVTDR